MSIYIFISILSYLIVIIISGKKGRIFILNLNYNSRLKKVNVVYTVNFIPVNPNITILSFLWRTIRLDSDIWFLLPDCIKWFYFFFQIKNSSNIILHKVQLFFKIVEFDLLSIFTGPLLSIHVYKYVCIHHAICQVICQYHQYMKQFTKKIFCRVVNVKCIGLQYINTTKWQLLSSIYCHPVNYKFTTWRFPH